MSFEDRLIEGAITTPDGVRYIFEFRDLEKTISKKTSTYTFGEESSALVQDFGFGEINYPLTIFFSGPDYDLDANDFEKSISKKGVSVLEHPTYGFKNVVVTSITRADPLATATNQAIFNLAITETIEEAFPVSAEETRSAILDKQEVYIETSAEAFEADFDASGVTDALSSKDRFLAFVDGFKNTFQEALNTVQEIQDTFNEIESFITTSIDDLLGAPLLLATSIQRLINTPSRLLNSVKSRIDGYLEAYSRILSDPLGTGTKDVKNQRQEIQLIATGILSGMASVYLFADTDGIGFQTKSDAIESAADLISQYNTGQEFLDQEEKASLSDSLTNRFSVSDTGTLGIKDIIANTSKNLIRLSFSLKQERIITLPKVRDMLTLCFELYGTSEDEQLQFFIDTNGLTGRDLVNIPIGREIRYYV